MNIEFKPIDRTNYNECIDLNLNEEQKTLSPLIFFF